jgi:hypothetical protein
VAGGAPVVVGVVIIVAGCVAGRRGGIHFLDISATTPKANPIAKMLSTTSLPRR